MARVCSVSGTRVVRLNEGWRMGATTPGAVADPTELDAAGLAWCPATVPATAASALRAAGRYTFDDRIDFDASDWWWRCRFGLEREPSPPARTTQVLCLRGLATLVDVWLNGRKLLRSENMFIEHELDVDALLQSDNEVVLCCRALATALKARRPRPRWRTRLVAAAQLRWFRTTLLGRIPAWSPPVAPVGPWREVLLERRSELAGVRADVRAGLEGPDGVVSLELGFDVVGFRRPARVVLRVADRQTDLSVVAGDVEGRFTARGTLRVPAVQRWWPHTHGPPMRHAVSANVHIAGTEVEIDLGRVGFRHTDLDTTGGGFALRVNGVDVFCRGACWTPVDAMGLIGSRSAYRSVLETVRRCGMNMLRIGGPFFYEEDAFYDLCDELGILLWQDYPFANMDYPDDDPDFVGTVEREVRGFLDRTQLACSIAVLCGNGEAEQQAAMMGAPRELWRSPLFDSTLRNGSASIRPDVPYWVSTPSGGPWPFSTTAGTTHYFGVGAYLRPLEDARRADVRFATECLAFANVPDDGTVDALLEDGGTPPTDPRWKARVPRDGGTGWDFDDVRDHYFRTLFGVDPTIVRFADVPRYLAMSRVVTGEVMTNTFAEWRRSGSRCAGALVWFLRDLWPGAGWGVLDASGAPKAAYYYLRRVLQPVTILLVDEGLNGLDVHVVNETPDRRELEVRLAAFRGDVQVATDSVAIDVGPQASVKFCVAAHLTHFLDMTYAYRFGPPPLQGTVATLVDRASRAEIAEAFHFPGCLPSAIETDVGLEAVASPLTDGFWQLHVRARHFAQAVAVEARGFVPDDSYFHLAPGGARSVVLRPVGSADRPQGTVRALNALAAVKIVPVLQTSSMS